LFIRGTPKMTQKKRTHAGIELYKNESGSKINSIF